MLFAHMTYVFLLLVLIIALTKIGDYEHPPMTLQRDSFYHNIQVMKNQVCQVLSTTSLFSQWTRLCEMKLYSSLKPLKFTTQGITYKVLLVGALALSSPPENKYIHKLKYSKALRRDITHRIAYKNTSFYPTNIKKHLIQQTQSCIEKILFNLANIKSISSNKLCIIVQS